MPKDMLSELKKMDKGVYQDAKNAGMTFRKYLNTHHPIPDELAKQGFDSFSLSVSQFLREQKTEMNAARVELFYQTEAGTLLFPEIIRSQILAGQVGPVKNEVTLEDLVGAKTGIDGIAYTKHEVDDGDKAKTLTLKKVVEGSMMPVTKITHGRKSVNLFKIGREIDVTYEVLRRMSMPLLSLHLQRIGQYMGRVKAAAAIYVILNGDDGYANGAPATAANWPLNADGLIDFDDAMENYQMTVAAMTKSTRSNIRKLASANALAVNLGFVPYDASVYKKIPGDFASLLNGKILGVDKSSALEYLYENGAQLIESERVIERQFQKIVISEYIGYSRLFTDAALLWTLGA